MIRAVTGWLLAAAGCMCAPVAEVSAQQPTRWIIGVDRSASRTLQQMRDAREFLDALVPRVSYGDSFTVMETFRTGTDHVRQWRDSVLPLRRPPKVLPREQGALTDFQESALEIVKRYTDTTGIRAITSTDLFGLLRRASEYGRTTDGRRTIVVLLSDMLQSTPELYMERRRVPGRDWVQKHAGRGMIPDLRGICVIAIGGETGTASGLALQRFWAEYFRAAGAKFVPEHYRSVMSPADIRC